MIKVSIIVPVYNTSKYLNVCLKSLLKQTLKDIEIICINDGSTDNSLEILKKYQAQDKRIKIIDQKNGGQANARNNGLKKAKGEYILFVDSDDYTETNMCERLFEVAIQGNYDIVCADYFINQKYNKVLKEQKSGVIDTKKYLFTDVAPWMKIFKKDFLKKNNFKFPEGIIYEDFASIPTLVKYNPQIYYLNEAFLHYVQSDNSTLRTSEYKTKYEDIFKAVNYLYDNLHGQGYETELEYLIAYHFLYLGALNFYKYQKYDQIDKISQFMHEKYPKWLKNKYLKSESIKQKILMYLLYHRKYDIISLGQRLERMKK